MSNNFRDMLPAPGYPTVAGIGDRDAVSHGDRMLASPRGKAFIGSWMARLDAPFVGVTCDGCRREGLFTAAANGAPVAAMVEAARKVLNAATGDERAALGFPIDARNWRMWSNPELYVNRYGLRLDEIAAPLRKAILGVLAASLGDRGFHKARACMLMNGFLGQLVGGEKVLNEFSYNFSLFGEPSMDAPWGWQLHGHHLALNCLVVDGQIVVSPTFMGAEPNLIDEGPHAGLTIFNEEEAAGLALMRSLPAEQRDRAQIYKQMYDPAMPEGRFHPADQRHLGGAFHDNRIIPYEGVRGVEFTPAQRRDLVRLCASFVEYLPAQALSARLDEVERHLDETRFCWIGQYGDEDPFYYRIQSPVIMIEFDHHSGVFLTNREPARCHIHTIVRTPNGNDYGKDILRQHYEQAHGVGARAGAATQAGAGS
ncbi:MAG TPA: DUF3500 domain-containing protein [Caulobacteraceae bacterium]|jgi:hypothetical protein